MLNYVGNASLNAGDKIEVYYSGKKKVLSIRQLNVENEHFNRIVAYSEYIHIENAVFVYRGDRKIIRGTFAGSIPVFPSNDHMVLLDDNKFYDLQGHEVEGANYCVCYLDMVLAEGKIYRKEKREVI
ncbi:hypothetical protein [Psychrobacillus sp. FSL H8-0487]|uniref:hypothetical protein n=1 Tax=Psychrobacillus sp. FSL H8-0487 TaxID=2921391 RepID=UPI0030F5022E